MAKNKQVSSEKPNKKAEACENLMSALNVLLPEKTSAPPKASKKAKLTPEEKKKIKDEKEAAQKKEREENNFVFSLKELRTKHINPPGIIRKVGDRVQHGGCKSSIITEILDDGKIYLLD